MAFKLVFSSALSAGVWFGFYGASKKLTRIEAGGGRLKSDGLTLRARSGRVAHMRDGRWRVSVNQSWLHRVRVEVGSEQEARDLLAALGLDRRAGTTQFKVKSLSFGATLPIELTVGVDGIHLSGFGLNRFIPHGKIRSFARIHPAPPIVVSPGVELLLDDGTVVKLDTRDERFDAENWEDDPVFDALVNARKNVGGEASATAMLQRGHRTMEEWLLAIREVGEGKTTYRIAPIDESALESVIADATAPTDARAAAAVALRVKDPARLRIALEDVADADVRRIALTADDDLEKELAELQRRANGM